jgi:hypothetical protein
MQTRALRLALLVVLTPFALGFVACGSNEPPPKPAGQSNSDSSSALSLMELRDCIEANSGNRTSVVLTQSEDEQMRYEDDLGAAAPDNVVRQALAADGGWLRLTYEPEDSRIVVMVSGMDVLDFGNTEAAQAGKTAVLAGTNEDGEPVSKFSQAVQVQNLVFVYERDYQDDGSGTVPGVIATAQKCLGKLGSTATLPEPKRIKTEPVE